MKIMSKEAEVALPSATDKVKTSLPSPVRRGKTLADFNDLKIDGEDWWAKQDLNL